MKMKLLFVPVVFMSALGIADCKPKDSAWPTQWTTQWTTEAPGLNLRGKMFTLARYSSGVTLYHPYFSISSLSLTPETEAKEETEAKDNENPPDSTYPYPTPPYWTTAPPRTGVSVCLRYMIDHLDQKSSTVFTLSPSGSFLSLSDNYASSYAVKYYYSNYVNLQPSVRLWSLASPSAWTSVCLTLDSNRRVVQMFKGPFMSIRKVLPVQYVWSGEPVMEFTGTDGQVKDVQVWNYPLRYKEVYYYMTEDSYWSQQGNILSWSHVRYSVRGQSFLEDSYESQTKQSIGRGSRLSRKFFSAGKTEDTKREMI
uniref:Uncharacterized protein n=1 Tax=Amphiprion percula TaxID=161767 RepID=A0A3P8RXQ3_AMPPE